jgi:hypothetical protein
VDIPAGGEATIHHEVWGFGVVLIKATAGDAKDSTIGFMFMYPIRIPPDAIWVWNCIIFAL